MMNLKEYAGLLKYINNEHSWANVFQNTHKPNTIFKFIDDISAEYDTKNEQIYGVIFKFAAINVSNIPRSYGSIDFSSRAFSNDECTVENIKKWLDNSEPENTMVSPKEYAELLEYTKEKFNGSNNVKIHNISSNYDFESNQIWLINFTITTKDSEIYSRTNSGEEKVMPDLITFVYNECNIENIKKWIDSLE